MTRTVISTTQCIIYLRLSDLKADDLDEHGNGKTFNSREQKLRKLAERLGWGVFKVIIENDVNRKNGKARNASAFKRRKITLSDNTTVLRVIRPGFREALDDLNAGRANGLLTEDLDRTMRDPRDLEDFIDIAEEKRVNARSLSGSLTFTDGGTDAEITLARNMVSFANAASRATSRRVSQARERQAKEGQWHGGRRAFGFEPDGVTQIPAEVQVIRHCAKRVVQFNQKTRKLWSLRALAAELKNGDVPTVSGAAWSAELLRSILLRPRNAGISIYKGEAVGTLPGRPILAKTTHDAVLRVLTDPARNTLEPGVGATPKWLGAGLYLCGIHCDGTACQVNSGSRAPRYICKVEAHLSRNAAALDAYVQATLLNRVGTDPRFVQSFIYQGPQDDELDTEALLVEADSIRVNLDGLAQDRTFGLIDRSQLHSATRAGQARLTEIDRALAACVVESPLTSLLGVEDVATVWEAQPLSSRRFILDTLMEVTVNPTRRGAGFDPKAVSVRFRDVGEMELAAA
ncbi:recombinase family protein [Amycolatopsis sp. CA-126428]|uniref:recombinase family protein n=1 Tax=Amycolatopsis sp. CA-126428 TaxID=2073158 RepID=UPI000CD2BBBA|nr:recombinase family protein [Amycolatopsis sp. CA-126428]